MADPYLRVHAVNIYVKDQARSLDFYLNTLGFHIAFDARVGPGERLLAVAPPDGAAVLTLIEVKPDSPQARLVGRATQVVFVTEDLPATYTEWRRRGVRFRNAPRLRRVVYDRTGDAADPSSVPSPPGGDRSAWGGAFTRFEDVDRNSFALVSFDEVSRAVEAQRRAAAEKQEAEQRAAHELEIAMQVQARLFPQRLPPMRTLEYAGACVQTRRVGGDYYDFLDLGRDRLGLVIGDIAGKGMPAALLMANLQANLRSQCATAVEQPERFLQTVNRLFYESTADNAYATFSTRSSTTGRDACATRTADICRRWCCDAPATSNGSSRRQRCWACSPRGSAGRRSSGFQQEIFWRSTPMGSPRPSMLRTTSSGKAGSSRRCRRIATCRHEI